MHTHLNAHGFVQCFIVYLAFVFESGEHLSKEKKKSYDSDEDEANPLVIEEDEGLHIDESHDSDVDERVKSSANNVSECGNNN